MMSGRKMIALLLVVMLTLNMSLPAFASMPDGVDNIPQMEEAAALTEPDVEKTEAVSETAEASVQTETEPAVEQMLQTETISAAAEQQEAVTLSTTSTRFDSFEQYLAYHYLTYSGLTFFLENDELPFQTYVEYADDAMKAELAAWRLLNMGAGEVATYTANEVDFYLFLIFDILNQKVAEDTAVENLNTVADTLQVSLLQEFAAAGMEWNGISEITPDNIKEITSKVMSTKEAERLLDTSAIGDLAEIIETSLNVVKTVDDLIQKLSLLIQLNDASEEVRVILERLYEKSSDPLMKAACQRMAILSTGLVTDAQAIAIFSGEAAITEPMEYALNELWESLLDSTAFGQGLLIGHGVGKLACNILWSTDAVVENWYTLQKITVFKETMEAVLVEYRNNFEDSPTFENAKLFNKAVEIYLNTLSVGMDYAVQFFEGARGGGVHGLIYKNLTGKEDYDAMHSDLLSVASGITLAIRLANNTTYNDYLADMEAYGVEIEWEETPCDTTAEEVQDSLSSLPDILFMLTNQTVSGDTSYSESHTTYGDYVFSGGTLDLGGQTLTVYGDFRLTSGTVNVNGGILDVRGNLYIQGGDLLVNGGSVNVGGSMVIAGPSNGSYVETAYYTNVVMSSESDCISIAGDLVTCFGGYSDFECTAGEMKIGGSWTDYTGATLRDLFRMTFTGSNDLAITTDDDVSIPTLVIENASSRNITMQGTINVTTLQGGDMAIHASNSPTLSFATTTGSLDIHGYTNISVNTAAGGDITFRDGAQINSMVLCGHSILVNGDLRIVGNVTLGLASTGEIGHLTVTGSYLQSKGKVHLNGGIVEIGGSMQIAAINSGAYSATQSYTYLVMDNDLDTVNIAGNLVTYLGSYSYFDCMAGEMRIGGNWTDYAGATTRDLFRMIFTGSNDLAITTGDDVSVPTLVIENASSRSITMQGTVSVTTLNGGDMTIHASNSPTLSFATTTGKLDILGYAALSVATKAAGDITFSEGAKISGMVLCGHSVSVNGDLWINGNVTLGLLSTGEIGTLSVAGNLQQTAGTLYLNGGTVDVGGDYIFANISSNSAYSATATGTYLTMDHLSDSFMIGGNLVTYGGTSSRMNCTAGEMKVGGGWINYNLAGRPSGSFSMTLTGTGDATLYGISEIYVPTLVIENASERTITMRGTVKAASMVGANMQITAVETPVLSFDTALGSMTIDGSVNLAVATKAVGSILVNGDLYSGGMTMGVHTLTVNGDLYLNTAKTLVFGSSGSLDVNGDIYLNAGTLSMGKEASISGGIFQSGGTMKANKASVSIAGDYRIQSADESTGEVEWGPSAGSLYMTSDSCIIVVGGDFHMHSNVSHSAMLTAGKLVVLGDFYQHEGSTTNFDASGTHTVQLCGNEPQSATFESAASGFNILQLRGNAEDYTFSPDGCWNTLEEGVEVPGEVKCLNGHTWNAGAITDGPDCETAGTRLYTCTACGETYHESIPALGHAYQSVETVPSCNAPGYTTHTCSRCGHSYTDGYSEAAGHTWNSGSVSVYPSCEASGSVIYTCLSCGDVRTQIVAAYGHDYEYEEIDPTCTEHGYILYTCEECGDSYRADIVDPIGHFYQDGLCIRCETAEEAVLASGICGDALTWTLTAVPDDLEGTLTISGTGNMWDFDESGDNLAPWAELELGVEITTVVIEPGCTSVGDYAFDGGTLFDLELKTVILADSITRIGQYAFHSYDDLETICLPENLKIIEESAFSQTGLLDVYIPDTVTSIRAGAFYNCDALVRVRLPEGLTEIEDEVFYDCYDLEHINLPETLTKIGDRAFRNTELSTLTLSASVTRIGEAAFYGCDCLEGSIFIGPKVVSIGLYAFEHCISLDRFEVSAENLYYSSDDRGVLYNKDKTIIRQAPGGIRGVYEIPATVKTIGADAFLYCYNLTGVTIPESVTLIGACAFSYCARLTGITIPESVATIGTYAFSGCTALAEITFLGDAPTFTTTSQGADTAFENVTAVVHYPAGNATWTQNVMRDYGGTITWVSDGAAEVVATGYSGETTWTLMSSGVLSFSGTGAMKNYTYKSEMPWYSYFDQITSVVIEDGVTAIGDYAFYGMDIESVEIPDTVTSIGSYAFKNAQQLDNVVLPDGLTRLGESAFYACTALTSIEIPASLWTIQPYTFKNCTSLAEVVFHEGNLQKISDGAFYATALTELMLPDCLGILDVYSFKNCTKLERITLGSGLTEIREAVFYGTAIPTVTIPEGITQIGAYAFKNCTKLVRVDLPATLTSVGEASFYACSALASLDLPDKVVRIGSYAFRKCTGLLTVTFGSGLTQIGEASFYGCTGLTGLVIPEHVSTIGAYAFKGCTAVADAQLPAGLVTLGDSAFHTCTGLTAIVIPGNVESIGAYCFSGSHGIRTITFAGNAPVIGSGAFNKLTATAYYPGSNATWTSDNMLNYGGTITWTAQ